MKVLSKLGWMPLVCTLTAAPLVSAGNAVDGVQVPSGEFNLAFSGAESSALLPMSEAAMGETRGEIWPFIAAVVATDLALATYFWGVYVPSVSNSGGQCGAACDVPDSDLH